MKSSKPEQRALALVEKAFAQAEERKGPSGRRMSLPVLKNRLLQLTNRQFKPVEYGAQDLKDLLERLTPRIILIRESGQIFAELRDSGSVRATSVARRSDRIAKRTALVEAAPHVSESGRIRSDLWMAMIDYTSGRRYVWDETQGIARLANSEDPRPSFPTVSADELDKWRSDFLEGADEGLDSADRILAERWRAHRLSTANLPAALQQRWNTELSRRVRQRLRMFFGARLVSAASSTVSAMDHLSELEERIATARDTGDFFTVGQLLAANWSQLPSAMQGPAFARMIAAWASSKGPALEPTSIYDLITRLDSFPEESVAAALVNAIRQVRGDGKELPEGVSDLAFRSRTAVAAVYSVDDRRSPLDICFTAVATLESAVFQLEASVQRFLRTTPATAKAASIEIVKLSHAVYPFVVPAERAFLRDLEVLVGPAFRKLCEAYERNDDVQVIRRAPEFLQNVRSHSPSSKDPRLCSPLWNSIVGPIMEHLSEVVEDAMSRGEAALAPSLQLRNKTTKADLRNPEREILLSFALQNAGRGDARDVSLQSTGDESTIQLSLVEPAGPFDVAPAGEQLVRVRVVLSSPAITLSAPIKWICQTTLGKEATFSDEIVVTQQVTEPNWELLVSDPPYSLNPIRRPDRLYGRDSALRKLTLAAMAGASTFVWGQKRIGKTSLLQVLCAKLTERLDTTCILLRMGEVASLHEAEIARLIAKRLQERSMLNVPLPPDAEFGAGIGRLIEFVEALSAQAPNWKFVVVIDEFDDLDAAFYTGERGKQFVKALRSISEAGLTFFFVGSERMEAIYERHQADLNKWTNIRLDRIDSRMECKALIANPVSGAIEFSEEAVDFIIDYCGGNPFYIHNFCYQVFDRCLQEHRTFVDDNDTDAVRQQLLRSLGPTNFSHFWEDNPLLDTYERRRAIAENCIALTCIGILSGRYEDPNELMEVQESLPLAAADRATATELRHACARLRARGILTASAERNDLEISLPIFREWLAENAVSRVLPIWTDYREFERAKASEPGRKAEGEPPVDAASFVISEDELIAVSQRLVFCGRQKDVADLRSWLRQFDDDARIEIAFQLLKRLAEKGFINEGMRSHALAHLEQMVRARRLEVGGGALKIVRGRVDNLCLTYVDSDLKSGAHAARELRNMMRPGKSGPASEMTAWMRNHVDNDPMIVVVDDFAGTGATLAKGLQRFREQLDSKMWRRYVDEGRISVFVMFAFPEAIENVRASCKGLNVVAATTLSDEVRGLSEEAAIFENESELKFARDVLLQIGRELYPSAPLGFGDLGSLVAFHNTIPNNTLPIFWSNGQVGERPWSPIFPRP